MAATTPVVYVLHGDDEFAIAQFISKLEGELGDPAMAAMNINRLDGRTYNPEDLLSVASAMPFLTARRLVVLAHPLARINASSAPSRQKFLDQLDKIPPTTQLVLVEYRLLDDEKESRDKDKKKKHWLLKWAEEAGECALVQAFSIPKGAALARWVQAQAKAAGGQINPQAAALLATLVGDDPRLAGQELEKLLAYVNYRRPVEAEDVQSLTPDSAEGDVFKMVDALATRDGRRAQAMLHRLLEQEEPIPIFGMVVRQFRLLLLAREIIDHKGQVRELVQALHTHPYVAEKVSVQARRFSLPSLEAVYHHLLDLDEGMKNGQMDAVLALETFVASFTQGV